MLLQECNLRQNIRAIVSVKHSVFL